MQTGDATERGVLDRVSIQRSAPMYVFVVVVLLTGSGLSVLWEPVRLSSSVTTAEILATTAVAAAAALSLGIGVACVVIWVRARRTPEARTEWSTAVVKHSIGLALESFRWDDDDEDRWEVHEALRLAHRSLSQPSGPGLFVPNRRTLVAGPRELPAEAESLREDGEM